MMLFLDKQFAFKTQGGYFDLSKRYTTHGVDCI